jgi:pimeloyl-ACP methyl ester carboxylesterase
MLPINVFRIWGTGLLSWALLAGGIYCLWEWADGIDPPLRPVAITQVPPIDEAANTPAPVETAETTNTDRQPPDRVLADEDRDRQGGWPYLAAGLAMLALSGGGFFPITLLLGRPSTARQPALDQGAEKWIDRPDGTRLRCVVQGPAHGPTLIFSHGWTLEGDVWGYQVEDLSGKYRTLVWDLPGLGQSRGPQNGDYSLEKMADDLAAVIDQAGPGPIVLVGHSISGMIAQTYCRTHAGQLGNRVAAIVLVHTTYTNPLNTAFLAPLWKALEKPLVVPLNYLTIWLAPLAWLSNWQSYLNGSMQVFTRIASMSGRQTWGELNYSAWLAAKAWPGVVARGNLAMLEFDEERTLPTIDLPVLVIAAEHDRMTQPFASEHIERLLPQGVLARVPAGHLGFWEQRTAVSQLIDEFAQRFAPEPGTLEARNSGSQPSGLRPTSTPISESP